MLTPQDVISAYQLLLGRQPESEATIQNYVNNASFEGLREQIFGSAEFASRIVAHPKILNVNPCVLGTTSALRLASRQLEHLSSLDLSIWGKSVLCPYFGPGSVSTFFIDRHCKLSICEADPDRRREKEAILLDLNRNGTVGNLEMCQLDVSAELELEAERRWQIAVDFDTDFLPRDLRRRVKNLAGVCSELLILDARVTLGDDDEIFVRRINVDGVERDIATPTRRWFMERLAAEMPYVYQTRTQPCHEDYPLVWHRSGYNGSLGRCVFVASHTPLSEAKFSNVLLDEQKIHG